MSAIDNLLNINNYDQMKNGGWEWGGLPDDVSVVIDQAAAEYAAVQEKIKDYDVAKMICSAYNMEQIEIGQLHTWIDATLVNTLALRAENERLTKAVEEAREIATEIKEVAGARPSNPNLVEDLKGAISYMSKIASAWLEKWSKDA